MFQNKLGESYEKWAEDRDREQFGCHIDRHLLDGADAIANNVLNGSDDSTPRPVAILILKLVKTIRGGK